MTWYCSSMFRFGNKLFATLFCLLYFLSMHSFAAVYYVDASRTDDSGDGLAWSTAKRTIQAAVDLTSDGDHVLVTNGVYNVGACITPGYSLTNRVCVTNTITIESAGGLGSTIIEGKESSGGGCGDDAIRCVYLGANAKLSGFILTNGFTRSTGDEFFDCRGGGVYSLPEAELTNCMVIGNQAISGGGGYGGIWHNCEVSYNMAHQQGGGCYTGLFYNCLVNGNYADESMGGGVVYGVLDNCMISNNYCDSGNRFEGGGGVACCTVYRSIFVKNRVSGVGGGATYSILNNCDLYRNSASGGGGAAHGSILQNCLVHNNYSDHKGGGTYLSYLYNCTVTRNSAFYYGGVSASFGYNSIVQYNDAYINENYDELSIFTNSCTYPVPTNGGNVVGFPSFADILDSDFHLTADSPCINAGNNIFAPTNITPCDLDGNPRIRGAVVDLGAYEYPSPTTYYVDASRPDDSGNGLSWLTAKKTIQAAADLAYDGDHILVTNGVYNVGGRVTPGYSLTNRVCVTNAITIESAGGLGNTIIVGEQSSGGGCGDDSIRCVYLGSNAKLSGFILTNGFTRSTGDIYFDCAGGGVYGASSAQIENCVLVGNGAISGGAGYDGIWNKCTINHNLAQSQGGGCCSGTFYNCIISYNSVSNGHGGGVVNGTLSHCTIYNNHADGSFWYWDDDGVGGGVSGCIVSYSDLFQNRASAKGGAAYESRLNQCEIYENWAGGLGGGANQSLLYNCLLYRNNAGFEGGGVGLCGVYNCTITANEADEYGGGVSWESWVVNSIVYGNSASLYENYDESTTLTNSCTYPATPNSGNIIADPLFENALEQNYRLNSNSPCINAGYNGYAPTNISPFDLDNNPRILFNTVDIGTYEYQYTLYVDAARPDDSGDGKSWTNAKKTIQGALDVAVDGHLILVANGIYDTGSRVAPGSSLMNRVCITNKVTLRSVNGAKNTIIKGSESSSGGKGYDAVRCVYIGSDSAQLIGFTITNGYTKPIPASDSDKKGGGIFVQYAASVSDCIIAGNDAVYGGGICGGVIDRCVVIDNSAQYNGGGVYGGCVYNAYLSANSAYKGGAASDCSMINCTLISNLASFGSGIYKCAADNSIIYYNNTSIITNENYSQSVLNYSCSYPICTNGMGNISMDPKLTMSSYGLCQLQSDSPCIDSGSLSVLSSNHSSYDLFMHERIYDGIVDMGACEYLPSVLYVDASRPNDYGDAKSWATAKKTIQGAVDITVAGNTILVTNGVYNVGGTVVWGCLLTNRVYIHDDIIVKSVNGPEVTIIEGKKATTDDLGYDAVRGVYLSVDAMLEGFTVCNGFTFPSGGGYDSSDVSAGGIYCKSKAIISNCVITGNGAVSAGGVYGGYLYDSIIKSNHAVGTVSGAYGALLNRCVIIANTGGMFFAVSRCDLNNCLVAKNTQNLRVHNAVFDCIVRNSTITDNEMSGVGMSTCLNSIVYNNVPFNLSGGDNKYCYSEDPFFVSPETGNYCLRYDSPCINAGNNVYAPTNVSPNDLYGNPRICSDVVDIGAYEFPATTYYVDASQLDDSGDGASWATAKKQIQSAVNLTQDGDRIVVTNGNYAMGGKTAPGLVLTNRVCITNFITLTSVNGPDVTSIEGASPSPNCESNDAVRCLYVESDSFISGFTMTNGHTFFYVSGDDRFGGGCFCSSNTVISNCVLVANEAEVAGGVWKGRLFDCELRANKSIYVGAAAISELTDCRIEDNIAPHIAGVDCCLLNNCFVSRNSGFVNYGSVNYSVLLNCTVVDNAAGGIFASTSINSIIYFNSSTNHGSSVISYSCTTPDPGGVGNITNTPGFIDKDRYDYRLSEDSPCVNSGNNDYAPTNSSKKDLSWNSRILYETVDMGAYEFPGAFDLVIQGWPDAHGSPEPWGYGTNRVYKYDIITNTITSPADEVNGTRYVCTGWGTSGAVISTGTGPSVSFQLTTNSTITWNWKTQHYLGLSIAHGSIEGTDSGWKEAGWIFDLVADPDLGYVLDYWNLDGANAGASQLLTVTMDQAHDVTAVTTGAEWDLNTNGVVSLYSWRQEGLWYYLTLQFCNPYSSGILLKDRFVFALPHPEHTYSPTPHGLTPYGEVMWDLTPLIITELDRRTYMEPGECVIVGELGVYNPQFTVFDGRFYARGMPIMTHHDTDRDGIPNEDESSSGLQQNNPLDAEKDQDGDQMIARDEYYADTDPFDATSYLGFDVIALNGTNQSLQWVGGQASVQYLEWSDNPDGPWTVIKTYQPPTAVSNVYDNIDSTIRGFYRIRCVR